VNVVEVSGQRTRHDGDAGTQAAPGHRVPEAADQPHVVSTNRVGRHERFAFWQAISQTLRPVPLDAFCDDTDDFRAELCSRSLGAVQVASLVAAPYWVQRSRRLIRQFDPERYHLMVSLRGNGLATQGRQEATLAPGDMVLYDSSRPMLARSGIGEPSLRILTATFPREMLPMPEQVVRSLLAVPLPGSAGLGKVVARFLADMIPGLGNGRLTGSAHLAEAVIELICAVLSDRIGSNDVDSAARRRALLLSAQKFIREHLADAELSPQMVASAHFISLRSLQLLFSAQGTTVSGWIRDQRLDRCRRDLSTPSLAAVPVRNVGARWGFTDAAHFSRTFRARFGVPPGEYRGTAHQETSRYEDSAGQGARDLSSPALRRSPDGRG
jgi:AraC-like DNA-binding protein